MKKTITVTITPKTIEPPKQTTNNMLMIEPVSFTFNRQTAENNYFQQRTGSGQANALAEFQNLAALLKKHGVNVITMKDKLLPHTPDAVFANNSVTFHDDGKALLYPMFAPNRRTEIDISMLHEIKPFGFTLREIYDMRPMADGHVFLEGGGSMVFDREARLAYACHSPRTDVNFFEKTCARLKYRPILFHAKQNVTWRRLPIHHTGLMMTLAEHFVIICLDAVDEKADKLMLLEHFERTQKHVITISEKQMQQFAGNARQVRGRDNQALLIMSTRAHDSLSNEQISQIESHCPIIHTDLTTIEDNGGGSVGAMLAEIFLPHRRVSRTFQCLVNNHEEK